MNIAERRLPTAPCAAISIGGFLKCQSTTIMIYLRSVKPPRKAVVAKSLPGPLLPVVSVDEGEVSVQAACKK